MMLVLVNECMRVRPEAGDDESGSVSLRFQRFPDLKVSEHQCALFLNNNGKL